MRNSNVKRLALYAMLAALAAALSWAERFVPLALLVPLPGIKLGLANVVTLVALYFYGARAAFLILLVRCSLGALMGGGIISLCYSLAGGLLAMAVMALVKNARGLSVWGVSVCGAAAHSVGQIAAACALLSSYAPVAYLPLMLCTSAVTGLITGALCSMLVRALITAGQALSLDKALTAASAEPDCEAGQNQSFAEKQPAACELHCREAESLQLPAEKKSDNCARPDCETGRGEKREALSDTEANAQYGNDAEEHI